MTVEARSVRQLAPGPSTEPAAMLNCTDRIGLAQQAILIFGCILRRKQVRKVALVSVEFATLKSD